MTNEMQQYFEILENIVADEYRLDKESDKQWRKEGLAFRLMRYLMLVGIAFVLIAGVGMCLAAIIQKLSWLYPVMMLLFCFSILLFSIAIFIVFLLKTSGLKNMRLYAGADSPHFSALMALSYETLALGALELEQGSHWFMKGLSPLLGTIDKVGLFPTIATLIAYNVGGNQLPYWVWQLLALWYLIYFLYFVINERMIRVNRLKALTLLAMDLKSKK